MVTSYLGKNVDLLGFTVSPAAMKILMGLKGLTPMARLAWLERNPDFAKKILKAAHVAINLTGEEVKALAGENPELLGFFPFLIAAASLIGKGIGAVRKAAGKIAPAPSAPPPPAVLPSSGLSLKNPVVLIAGGGAALVLLILLVKKR